MNGKDDEKSRSVWNLEKRFFTVFRILEFSNFGKEAFQVVVNGRNEVDQQQSSLF
jgi:hypothetical protein